MPAACLHMISATALVLAMVAGAGWFARRRAGWMGVHILLVDNGSLRADSFVSLRSIAARVSDLVHLPVLAASARFADRVTLPDGGKGASLESAARAVLAADGNATFLILPAFFGPSDTLTEFVPTLFAKLTLEYPALRYSVARAAVDVRDKADDRISRAMLDKAVAAGAAAGFAPGTAALAVCDHGSPVPAVGAVRGHVAAQMAALATVAPGIAPVYRTVLPCSMERREGATYDFNAPLLEDLLRTPPFDSGNVILSLLFISPGKHAGDGGDLDHIVASAIADASAAGRTLCVAKTALMNETQALVDVLADRLREAVFGAANA